MKVYLFAIILIFLNLKLLGSSMFFSEDSLSSSSDEYYEYSISLSELSEEDLVDKENKASYRKKLITALEIARTREDIPMIAFIYLKSRYIYISSRLGGIGGSIVAGACLGSAPFTMGLTLIPGAAAGGLVGYSAIKSHKYKKVKKHAKSYLKEFLPMKIINKIDAIAPSPNWRKDLITLLDQSGIDMNIYLNQSYSFDQLDWI